jgi:hypothetical protein
MFAPLLGAVRADIGRQVGWARDEVNRQTRHTALTAGFAIASMLAALGAVAVGLIALYAWLAAQTGPFIALGTIGAGLLLIALTLSTLALVRRRPRVGPRPTFQIARPATLIGILGGNRYGKAGGDRQALRAAAGAVQDRSRSALLGALAIAAAMIAGRRSRVK